jgi:hypothetical protein
MSSQDESSRKAKTTRKKNKMKMKKTIKLRDLTPTRDVRGGHRRFRGRLLNQKEDPVGIRRL